jgi:catechol 2,3-dioxygenase-like lactoylglutathione lyase family enzyme
MAQRITRFALLVRAYDEAISFYVGKLGFQLVEDTDLGDAKRWVRVRPRGPAGPDILLARAVTPEQHAAVGKQTRAAGRNRVTPYWRTVKDDAP